MICYRLWFHSPQIFSSNLCTHECRSDLRCAGYFWLDAETIRWITEEPQNNLPQSYDYIDPATWLYRITRTRPSNLGFYCPAKWYSFNFWPFVHPETTNSPTTNIMSPLPHAHRHCYDNCYNHFAPLRAEKFPKIFCLLCKSFHCYSLGFCQS